MFRTNLILSTDDCCIVPTYGKLKLSCEYKRDYRFDPL